MAIHLSHNEKQAERVISAFLARGMEADDAQVHEQIHNKAINQALRKSYYGLANILLDQGAKPGHVVHAYFWRPKSVGEAKKQQHFIHSLWEKHSEEARQTHALQFLVSLAAAEVLGGEKTRPDVREGVLLAMERSEQWRGNLSFTLSHLNDACQALKNGQKANQRLTEVFMDWHTGIEMEALTGDTSSKLGRFEYIPAEFFSGILALKADIEASRIAGATSLPSARPKGNRL